MKTMTQIVKKREDMFKSHYFKTFPYNPNDPNVDLFKFVGEIILCISTLCEENAVNGVIMPKTFYQNYKK